jgi:hypothetical protein
VPENPPYTEREVYKL